MYTNGELYNNATFYWAEPILSHLDSSTSAINNGFRAQAGRKVRTDGECGGEPFEGRAHHFTLDWSGATPFLWEVALTLVNDTAGNRPQGTTNCKGVRHCRKCVSEFILYHLPSFQVYLHTPMHY